MTITARPRNGPLGFGKYIKTAFVNRWNMLLLLGACGFALLSGHPDIALPLVVAGEVGYLGLIATHPKFQKYVDAQEHKASRENKSVSARHQLNRILDALPRSSRKRFETLTKRCEELRNIALNLKGPGDTTSNASLDQLRLAGLDRMLWLYLKLLYSEHSLGRFFETTDQESIANEITQLESRIEQERKRGDDGGEPRERIMKTLNDNLQTSRDRMANYKKAMDNYELVFLELKRLETKIQTLGEMAVNRNEPDFITGQVDEVSSSMLETEHTLNELEFVTGFHTSHDEEVPELMQRSMITDRN